MELRHLRYFAAVASHGSFSRAAQGLHLTQPALSRQVKDLEEELGVPLFVRGTNTLALTPAGELFYDEARDLLARADEAVQRVRGETRREVLRVGYVPSLVAGVMPRVIERFQNGTPRVRLELFDLAPAEMANKASGGQLDLVLAAAGIEPITRGFSWVELRRLHAVVVMARAHPLARLKRIPPASLRDTPLFGLDRRSYPEYVPRLRALLKPFDVTPRLGARTADGIAPLFTALEAHGGVAVLTSGIAPMLPQSLVMRPFAPALEPVLLMLGLPAVRPSVHAEAFARLLQAERGGR
jgi:DNA-binding transcriptional LysR family regulator